MHSIKLIDKEIERLRLQAQGKHKEAEKIASQIMSHSSSPLAAVGSVRQADHDNQAARDLESQAAELEKQRSDLQSRLLELETELGKLRDKYEADKARLDDDYRHQHDELESERLRIIG